MKRLRAWMMRLGGLFGGVRRERELADELDSHLEMHIDENLRAGMTAEEARRDAVLRLGGVEQTKQAYRERRTLPLFRTTIQDLHFSIRQLRKSPGFTSTAILTLVLGLCASISIFAFVDAALVKSLPYRDPSRLVGLFERIPVGDRYHLSYFDYLDWKNHNHVFASLDVYEQDRFTLNTATGAEQARGARVSDDFFRTLGVAPFLGRDFRRGEDQPSAQRTVMLSYGTWQKRFGGDKNAIGGTTILDGVPYLVIGVLPSGFHFVPVEAAEFWATLHGDCPDSLGRECHRYYGVARLKGGVSAKTAFADIASIAGQIATAYPRSNRDRGATVIPLASVIVGDIRPILLTLLIGAGLLLLIGFVNVSSLLLVRAEGRRREIAVRVALGASGFRLICQFAVEGFLLAATGCGLGLASAFCTVRILARLIPHDLLDSMPYLRELYFDAHLVLFAVVVSIIGGVLFSAAPAIQLFPSNMEEGLKEGGRTAAGRSWRKAGSSLVVVELATAIVLLVSAGLLGKSFYRLLHVDIGISGDHLAVLHVLKLGASTDADEIGLERQVLSRLAALPGVTSAGVSDNLAVGGGDGFAHFRVAGRSYLGEGDEANDRLAGVGYFETLRAQLIHGRYFTEADDGSKPRVAIINQTMANQAFPGEDPLRKRIVNQYDQDHPIEIVGVVNDIKEGPLDRETRSAVYTPFNQAPTDNFFVTLRASQPEETMLRPMVKAVHDIDAGLIVDGEDTMTDRINNSQSAYLHRCAAWVVATFAAVALLLGTIGLYGIVSYSVSQRTREIGVRMALGAQRGSVYRMILREAGWLIAAGVVVGLGCSLGAGMLMRTLLFGVKAWDVPTLVAVAMVLALFALMASYLPARRAASVNPVEALRAE
jgi:macrolide transport system ATP-binding/permease protein